MTVYEVLCLLNPGDEICLVDSRDPSTLYSKFSYRGRVSELPFRPDVWNHTVYRVVSKNGVLYIHFNEIGFVTGVLIFNILCSLESSQKVFIQSEFSERFSGKVSELTFDSELFSLRVQKLESFNDVVVITYFIPNEKYNTFRCL